MAEVQYTEENIRSLDWKEHIRLRPGMYIGKLGDGSAPDDGIYVLLKEILDNSIDEFVMGNGKQIDIFIKDKIVTVRDYGRGIPPEFKERMFQRFAQAHRVGNQDAGARLFQRLQGRVGNAVGGAQEIDVALGVAHLVPTLAAAGVEGGERLIEDPQRRVG